MPPSSTTSDPPPLLNQVQGTLIEHAMLATGDRVLVGVSGGPDSMALLHLLGRIAPRWNLTLGVAHLNHCLRGAASDSDAEAVRRTAAALDYPYHAGRARVMRVKRKLGLSLEEAARRVRYAFFNKVMVSAGYTKLALGHHMDDNAEQVLLALLRGTGPRGLSGIAPMRENRIIRPLIASRRSQIEAYIHNAGISCVRDASNTDTRFLRNRIRCDLMPLLAASYNPRIVERLNGLADVMRTEEAWMKGVVGEQYRQAVLDRSKDSFVLAVQALRTAPTALSRRMIRMALEVLVGNLRRIELVHVQSVQRLVDGSGDRKEIHLPGGIRVRRSRDRLVLSLEPGRRSCRKAASPKKEAPPTTLDGPFPKTVEIAEMGLGLHLSPCTCQELPAWKNTGPERVYLDADRLNLPLTIRSVRPGDRFAPLGAGGSQKLKKFFVDHRIPRDDRANAAVIADTQGIVWLVGQRIDERVKVTPRTTRVLSIEFFLLDTR